MAYTRYKNPWVASDPVPNATALNQIETGIQTVATNADNATSILQGFSSRLLTGNNSPEGVVTAAPGSLYLRSNPTAAIPEVPVISRGVPVTDSGGFAGSNAASNAVDGDYGTYWRSITSPNGGTPQWIVLDLRNVAPSAKANLRLVWKNPTAPFFLPSATLGSDPASLFGGVPRNYKIQGHTSSGSQPAVGDAGWVDLLTVTDNRLGQVVLVNFNLSTYNWFRFYITAANGITGSTDDVQLQLDLRSVTLSKQDHFFAYGDSITMEAFGGRRIDNAFWVNIGPIENAIQTKTGRTYGPVFINGGTGGWTAAMANTNKATYMSMACKYSLLNFGTNDANFANIDLGTVSPAGVNSTYAQQYKTDMQALINYVNSFGNIAIIPKIPYSYVSSWTAANVGYLNQIIDQLWAANPTSNLLPGPDLYSFFAAHPNCLRDALHPTWDNSVSGGLYNGLTGYENYLLLWRNWFINTFYGGGVGQALYIKESGTGNTGWSAK